MKATLDAIDHSDYELDFVGGQVTSRGLSAASSRSPKEPDELCCLLHAKTLHAQAARGHGDQARCRLRLAHHLDGTKRGEGTSPR